MKKNEMSAFASCLLSLLEIEDESQQQYVLQVLTAQSKGKVLSVLSACMGELERLEPQERIGVLSALKDHLGEAPPAPVRLTIARSEPVPAPIATPWIGLAPTLAPAPLALTPTPAPAPTPARIAPPKPSTLKPSLIPRQELKRVEVKKFRKATPSQLQSIFEEAPSELKNRSLEDLAKEYQINVVTLKSRIAGGMGLLEALTAPVRKYTPRK